MNYPDFTAYAEFPSQLVGDSTKKTEKWKKDCVDAVIGRILYSYDSIRKTRTEKVENYDIVYGKYDPKKLKRYSNPLLLETDVEEDENMEELFDGDDNIAILKSVLDTLVGEQYKRPFEPKAFTTNPDAVSEKERMVRDKVAEFLTAKMQMAELKDDQLVKEIQELVQWRQYGVQSIHEDMANNILNYYIERLRFKHYSVECWKDLVISAEEIGYIGISNNDPYVGKCNPLQILYKGNGQSSKIEDATMIIHWEYYNFASMLKEFKGLTPKQIKELEGFANEAMRTTSVVAPSQGEIPNMLLPIENIDFNNIGFNWFTRNGNVLVIKVSWLSQRKIGDLTYFDEFGDEQHKYVSEHYVPDVSKGETVEWLWIPEWWSGVKIGNSIYTDIKPNPVQFRSNENIFECKPMYRGRVSNINAGKAYSVIDAVKPYAYEYLIYFKKLKHLWLTNYGKIANIDLASIPNGTLDDGTKMDYAAWMHILRKHRIALRNSFQEDGRGHVAGNYANTQPFIDMSAAEDITQVINYLEYLEAQISKLSGISPQRKGDISPSEQVGTARQATYNSVTQTEWLFKLHDEFQIDMLKALLEVAKYCLKDKKELQQYILTDAQIAFFELNGEIFNSADYDIQVTNSTKILELENMLKTDIISRAIQAGTINLSDAAMLLLSNSPSSTIEQLKRAEEKKRLESMELEKSKISAQQEAIQIQMQMKQMEHRFKLEEIKLKGSIDIEIEKLRIQDKINSDAFSQYSADVNANGVDDAVELTKLQMTHSDNERKRQFEADEAKKQRQFEADQNDKDREVEIKKINKQKLGK